MVADTGIKSVGAIGVRFPTAYKVSLMIKTSEIMKRRITLKSWKNGAKRLLRMISKNSRFVLSPIRLDDLELK